MNIVCNNTHKNATKITVNFDYNCINNEVQRYIPFDFLKLPIKPTKFTSSLTKELH